MKTKKNLPAKPEPQISLTPHLPGVDAKTFQLILDQAPLKRNGEVAVCLAKFETFSGHSVQCFGVYSAKDSESTFSEAIQQAENMALQKCMTMASQLGMPSVKAEALGAAAILNSDALQIPEVNDSENEEQSDEEPESVTRDDDD